MRRTLALIALATLTAATLTAVPSPASAAVTWTTGAQSAYEPARNGGLFYAYAPSVIADGGRTHYWTCHNSQSGVVQDDIFHTRTSGSAVEVDASVLSRSGAGWDSFHICDPSVVRLDATYQGTTYRYAMFYLGNDQNCSCRNQIGVALATGLDGPWVKYPAPLVTYPNSTGWGVGQPSATTVDVAAGRVLLFYTADDNGVTRAYRRDVTIGNAAAPAVGAAVQLTTGGLTGSNGGSDYLNNFDVAYDPSRDRFYAVREMHPYPGDDPAYIGAGTQLVSIDGASVWNGGGTWRVEQEVTPALTGYARNHNAGIERTVYGTLPSSSSITVVFTDSTTGPDSLWSYSLHRITGTLG